MKKSLLKAKKWIKKNESNILIFFSLILVAVVAFEIGVLKSQELNPKPIVIEVPDTAPTHEKAEDSIAQIEPSLAGATTQQSETKNQNCLFVGSKNSDKFHSPTCHWAKQIKPQNIVCFLSREEAEKSGYKEGCIE